MAKVTGIGGIFFRARDTKALAAWYEEHLGVTGYWPQVAGMTVFAPFAADTTYFPADKAWMLNLRVDDLDGMIAKLTDAGIAVETRPGEWDSAETGRFGRLIDPEGMPVELWQPPVDEA